MRAGLLLLFGVALILFVTFSVFIGSRTARAQDGGDLGALDQQAAQLIRTGNYAKATSIVVRALRLAERRFGRDHRRVAYWLGTLAYLDQLQGRYAEAEPLYKRALAIHEKMNGPDAQDVGTDLNGLATLYNLQGRNTEAEPLYKRALAIHEKVNGPDDPDVGTDLNDLAELYRDQGRDGEAEPLMKRAIAIAEKTLGPDHSDVATRLNSLAELYDDQGRYAEAEPLYKRALAIHENANGPNDPDVGTDLNNLALLYDKQSRYAEAEPLYRRTLAIAEKAVGPHHSDIANRLNNLGALYYHQGRYAEAEPLYKRALTIDEKTLGPDAQDVGTDLNNLAVLYVDRSRYAEAEPLYKRALAIAEKAVGPDHPVVGTRLNNLAELYRDQGRYGEAEPLYKRALAISEKALGSDHPTVGTRLNNLAELYRAQGRDGEAEPLYKRALAIAEKAFGPDHPDVGRDLNNLAELYRAQGRYVEAEPLCKRALAIAEKTLGPHHAQVGIDLSNLAVLYVDQGRYAEAEPLYKRALAIHENANGPNDTNVGTDLNNLALLYDKQSRYAEAEPLYKRALAIHEKVLGPDHPQVGIYLGNLAELYRAQGRYGEAEPLYKRALTIDEKALGPDHPNVSADLSNLAGFYYARSDWVQAANYWRSSTSVLIRRATRGALVGAALTGKRESEASRSSLDFQGLVKAVYRLTPKQHDETGLLHEMFQTAQWAQSSEAAESLSQMAARGAKGDPKLAAFVRERQDLVVEWQKRDQIRSAAIAQSLDKRNRQAESENVARLAAIDARIAIIDKELAENFPDYAVLASPAPLSVEEVQDQLAADEALVLFLDTPELKPTSEETFIWVVTKSEVRWVRSDLGTPALTREVSALRSELDPSNPLPFDLARAHALYKGLFGEVEELMRDKRLLIVPSGSLTQLPFQVLVTEPPKTAFPSSFADYRAVAWLAGKHAIMVLPAVSSLKALRELAKKSHASEPYIGFGNPLLNGPDDHFKKRADEARARQSCADLSERAVEAVGERGGVPLLEVRGALASVTQIRAQAPLPETANEVCEVARDLGSSDIRLGAAATETEVKRLSETGELSRYKVVHFATHGALAGQVRGNVEPGLLLTPPNEATENDDGYLTASEIAGLKLDADWVILSACNTAAGGAQGAEALSGLARAFFYAGARSLLVSHWEVSSDSTVKLITKAFAELNAGPKIGRAEALRRSMLSLIKDGKEYEAHPAFWAPFVLVGEGGAAR
jgi:CHAT domain-containing protein/tetratricopeptide (TPR) repeat protein